MCLANHLSIAAHQFAFESVVMLKRLLTSATDDFNGVSRVNYRESLHYLP